MRYFLKINTISWSLIVRNTSFVKTEKFKFLQRLLKKFCLKHNSWIDSFGTTITISNDI